MSEGLYDDLDPVDAGDVLAAGDVLEHDEPRVESEDDRPLALVGAVEWGSCCPKPGMPGSPAVLAARVEAALDRADRVMFRVTPREELSAAARWQLVADQAWCGQLRGIVASTARMSSADRDFAGDELALALGLSPGAGQMLVWRSGAIASLPGLVEAVESGRLTRRHVLAFMDQLDAVDLTLEQRQAVALICLARYTDQTPAQWAELVRRLILTVDPQAARARREVATEKRRASFFPRADQQGGIWIEAPVEAVAAAQARVSAEARRLKNDGDPRTLEQLTCDVALELLTHGQLNGQPSTAWDVQVITPLSVVEGGDLEVAEIPGFGPLLPSTARQLVEQAAAFTQIAVNTDGHVIAVSDQVRADKLRTAGAAAAAAAADAGAGTGTEAEGAGAGTDTDEGAVEVETRVAGASGQGGDAADHDRDGLDGRAGDSSDAAGEDVGGDRRSEAGHEGQPGRTAPTEAQHPSLTPVGSDDFLTRAVVAMRRPPVVRDLTSSGYRPGGRLTRFIQARDRTCVFPGCGKPARRTDLDHRNPWPSGRTTVENLQCLCRHHHLAKHSNVFTVLADDDGSILWITRGGWIFRRRPQGY